MDIPRCVISVVTIISLHQSMSEPLIQLISFIVDLGTKCHILEMLLNDRLFIFATISRVHHNIRQMWTL